MSDEEIRTEKLAAVRVPPIETAARTPRREPVPKRTSQDKLLASLRRDVRRKILAMDVDQVLRLDIHAGFILGGEDGMPGRDLRPAIALLSDALQAAAALGDPELCVQITSIITFLQS
jgi:hypothetical protein